MKALKLSIAVAVTGGLISSGAAALPLDDPESCQAFTPSQPKCKFTVTSGSTSGTVTGAVGMGDWIVVVKRGKVKMKFGPSTTDPEPVSFQYEVGDKVTATVKSTPGWVVAGHD